LGFVTREARLQDLKNRQNSIEINLNEVDDIMSADILIKDWEARQAALADMANEFYAWAIKNNIAKEQARAVLPEGLTVSRMYMNGSLRSWITYISIREKEDTQKEHRQIAKECKRQILEKFH
jgi:thymidylate synthase (FAD)